MSYLIAVLVGSALGVLFADGRIPSVRRGPLIATAVLAVSCSAVLVLLHADAFVALAFVVSVAVSSSLYAGAAWSAAGLDTHLPYWGIVWRYALSPRSLNELASSIQRH
ncbi:MAG: hypothetical protein J0J05_07835 [Microbacterium sp.]|uniref:hypothetical protein n=1 Tax=Microbacterium sp. TaxID=51671 RepID=UPI001AC02E58|nr:hypothetical protein [Microbacterium sp.]MBN9153876.1 hypothetical protein [Microbacterium sp.]